MIELWDLFLFIFNTFLPELHAISLDDEVTLQTYVVYVNCSFNVSLVS